jgi:hypothetical protein
MTDAGNRFSDAELCQSLDGLTWQCSGNDEWAFGLLVRGIVRHPYGEVYFDDERADENGGWVWFVYPLRYPSETSRPRGAEVYRRDAIDRVEQEVAKMLAAEAT